MFDFLSSSAHREPIWRLTLNDRDITRDLQGRISTLTLTDNRGFSADTLSVSISDHDGAIPIPNQGAKLEIHLGWAGTPLIPKGIYIIDEIMHTGAPDMLTVSAKSADFNKKLLEQKNKSYNDTTLGAVVADIAQNHGLPQQITPELASISIKHLSQQNESDANLLTRLAKEYDAFSCVKNQRLLFMKKGGGVSASGVQLPTKTVTRGEIATHSYRSSERESVTGVKAYYYDVQSAKKIWVLAGTDDRVTSLKKAYSNAEDAELAAKSELTRRGRGEDALTLNYAFGDVTLYPELPIKTSGFKKEIDAMNWVIVKATHGLTESGLITSIDCETFAD